MIDYFNIIIISLSIIIGASSVYLYNVRKNYMATKKKNYKEDVEISYQNLSLDDVSDILKQDNIRVKKEESHTPLKEKKEEHIKEEVAKGDDYIRLSSFNPALTNSSKMKFKYWKQKFFEKFLPHRSILINMEFNNGFHRSFIIPEKEASFEYQGGKYVVDPTKKYFNLDAKLYCLDYHESFSLPLKRELPIADVKETLESPGVSEIEYATSPKTLERFIISKVAEGVMRGQALDDWMRQVRMMVIITLIIALGHLLIFLQKSGVFAQVNIPGL